VASREPCPTCRGSGTVPRSTGDVGADATLNPQLSKAETICPNCGGLGHVPEAEVRRRAIDAARRESG
jgi:DnaJ-class molecular chaperone